MGSTYIHRHTQCFECFQLDLKKLGKLLYCDLSKHLVKETVAVFLIFLL